MRSRNTKSPTTLQYYLEDEARITHKQAQFLIAAAHRLHRVRKDLKLIQDMGLRFRTNHPKFPIVIQLRIRDILLDVNDRLDSRNKKREISVRQRNRLR